MLTLQCKFNSLNSILQTERSNMETLFTAEAWASPGGVGFFIVCIGVFFYLIFNLDKKKK
jgi:hypothetical protein